MAEEIERRFLVPDLSKVPRAEAVPIVQGYLLAGNRPGVGNLTVVADHGKGAGTLRLTPCNGVPGARRRDAVCYEIPPGDAEALAALLPHAWVRVRLSQGRAWLTLKGKATGYTCPEYEYPIPFVDGEVLLHCYSAFGVLNKTRRRVPVAERVFEVDEFEGTHAGLVVAEVELPAVDTHVAVPEWAGREISGDRTYSNAALAMSTTRPALV